MGNREQSVETKPILRKWIAGAERVVVAGIGNPFRRDDFVGVEVVRKLQNKVSEAVFLIEAETIPESYIQKIITFNPTHILLIDAGIINQKPGTLHLADTKELTRKSSISTHTLPLRIFCDYLIQSTHAKISILAIQPQDTSFGEGLTPRVKQTASGLANILQRILP